MTQSQSLKEGSHVPVVKHGISTKYSHIFVTEDLVVNHEETIKTKSVCHICAKLFFNNFNLKSHMQTRGEQEEFKCNICNKTFRTKSICVYTHPLPQGWNFFYVQSVARGIRKRQFSITI